jgi:hypothetical protein
LPPDKQAEIKPYADMRSRWPGMISSARDLAARLRKLSGGAGYDVRYDLIVGEDHSSSAFVAIGRAMRFAFLGPGK